MPSRSFRFSVGVSARKARCLCLLAGLLAVTVCSPALGAKWEPVPAADLAALQAKNTAGADSEILFARHVLNGSITENHVRAKVYTRKGVETVSVLSIEHGSAGELSQLVARIVKPNGASVELKKSEFHETLLWKRGDAESRRTTFAFPNLEPGDVVEYRWAQEIPQSIFSYYRFFCQAEDVFTREYSFEVKRADFDYQVMWENCPEVDRSTKNKVIIRNLRPFIKEPLMPPQPEFRASLTIIYTHPWLRQLGLNAAWNEIGPVSAYFFNESSKPDKRVIAKVAELRVASLAPVAQVEKIYRFVQTEIANLTYDNTPTFAAAKKKRKKMEEPQTPAQTLERRSGDQWDLTLLFASLVKATGLDVRLGMSADRQRIRKIDTNKGWVLADRRLVVVNFGEQRFGFYTPGERFVPSGILDKRDEGAQIMIVNEHEWRWGETPVAKPEQTRLNRKGVFTLDAEGTLQGSVTLEFTGHRAIDVRTALDEKSAEEVLRFIRENLSPQLPTAELSGVAWENLGDNDRPLVLRYRLTVPGYAESAGSRLLLPMNCFTANSPAIFSSERRRFPILLPFAETCVDEISLTLPAGFEPDGAKAPARIGDISTPVDARYSLEYTPTTRTIEYRRDYVMGGGGNLNFAALDYHPLRWLFDRLHLADLQQLVLTSGVAAPSDGEVTPAEDPVPSTL